MRYFIPVLFLLAVPFACQHPEPTYLKSFDYAPTKSIQVKKAAVISAQPLASAVGKYILEKGGNAVDAAIAMQYTLAVVYPGAGNLGGGGFMVIHNADGWNTSFDYREKAPAASTRDMYLNEQGEAVNSLSRDGHLASGVPGTVAGLFQAHKAYGKLRMQELIQPAIELARQGFVLSQRQADRFNAAQEDLKHLNTRPSVYVREGGWKAGDTLQQKDLSKTLERIQKQGAKGFYEGETARLIVEEMQRGGGIITLEDLKQYQAVERKAHTFTYKDYKIVTMGLPSSGGMMLQQMFGMLESYPVGSYGYGSVPAVQLMTEIERRSFADRTEYLGDPDFVDVPIGQLTNKAYLKQRMADFDPHKPTPSTAVRPGLLVMSESDETTHICVVDKAGNAVSVTVTLNGAFGNRVMIDGAGFLMNNEMDDFSAQAGNPNIFGLLGTEANKIAPDKRMLSSMTPTIVLRNDKPLYILGTPGGSTIITTVFQTLVNLMEFNLSVKESINRPFFHHQWKPDQVDVEKGFPKATMEKMKAMGYTFQWREFAAGMEVIKVDDEGIEAVGDSRGDDSAAGY